MEKRAAAGVRRLVRRSSRLLLALVLVLLIAYSSAPLAVASNDPLFNQQWGIQRILAEQAWSISTGAGITVAVVDTGVDLGHEDLSSKMVAGWDFVDNDPLAQDETAGPGGDCGGRGNPGHGSHVAGIAGAATNNGRGVAGTAPGARIMPVRAMSEHGCGFVDDIVDGIAWAADRGAHVINLSLGDDVIDRNVFGSSLTDAIEYAWVKGAVVAVAGGNDEVFPSGYRNINAIVVGATDQNDNKSTFSNLSEAKWAITAPGSGILSTLPGAYGTLSGTSMATPHVAGAVAVLRCLGYGKQQAIERLLATADDLGVPGKDPVFGSGRLNLARAVEGKPAGSCTGGASVGGSSGGGGATGGSSSGSRSSSRRPGGGSLSAVGSAPPPATGEPLAETPVVGPDETVTPYPRARANSDRDEGPNLLVLIALAGVILAGGAYFAWLRSRPTP